VKPETHALLAARDHATACECPPGFDWERAVARVRELMPELKRIAGIELQLDTNVEDASFFCDLACYREERPGMLYPVLLVRFSSFGRLVTLTHAAEISDDTVAGLVAALADAGFVFVAEEELSEPYTGINLALRNGSWWIRFFDYL